MADSGQCHGAGSRTTQVRGSNPVSQNALKAMERQWKVLKMLSFLIKSIDLIIGP